MRFNQIISIITMFFIWVPYFSFAQVPPPESLSPPEIPTRLFSCLPTDTLRICLLRLLGDVLRVILVIALAFAAVMIAWAGIRYIMSGGKFGEKELDPRNQLIFAAFGLVIAFLAWVITVILTRIISGAAI